jgi:hypothetical protein
MDEIMKSYLPTESNGDYLYRSESGNKRGGAELPNIEFGWNLFAVNAAQATENNE